MYTLRDHLAVYIAACIPYCLLYFNCLFYSFLLIMDGF